MKETRSCPKILTRDQWKGSLVGHSNNNGDEDTGHLHVTYAGVWFDNINSRTPMYRFGEGHIFK